MKLLHQDNSSGSALLGVDNQVSFTSEKRDSEENQFNIIKSASATNLVATAGAVMEADARDEGTFIENTGNADRNVQLSTSKHNEYDQGVAGDDSGAASRRQPKNDITTDRSSPELMYYVPIDDRH